MDPIPQNILAHLGKPSTAKAKKIAVPKVAKVKTTMLKGLISNAKSQVSGLSKSMGKKSAAIKPLKMMGMPSMKASKLSTSLKRGLSRLG